MRWKLDHAAVKLSLTQWRSLPPAVRETFIEAQAVDVDVERFRLHLARWAEKLVLGPLAPLDTPVADVVLAQCADAVPNVIGTRLSERGHPGLDPAQWQDLPVLRRYALLKLARHRGSDQLLRAVAEFGLEAGTRRD